MNWFRQSNAARQWRLPRTRWSSVLGLLALAAVIGCWPNPLWAQTDGLFFEKDPHGMWRGPGGYFAGYKLLIVVLVFTVWVATVDYANREALRLDDHLKTKAPVWSPFYLGGMLLGLIAVLAVPWFWAGLPVFILLAFAPVIAFFVNRNREVDREMQRSVTNTGRIAKPIQLVEAQALPVDLLPQVPGKKPAEIVFHARRLPGFTGFVGLCDDLIRRRGENIVVSCNRETAVIRIQIDGMWHPIAELESAAGQGLIAVGQVLLGGGPELSPRPVNGQFGVKKDRDKFVIRFSVVPGKTEIRGQLRLDAPVDKVATLADLGMTSAQLPIVRRCMDGDGFFVVAATPTQGSTTLWKSTLNYADRWTRDWYAIVPESDTETQMENIQRLTHPDGDVDQAIALLRQVALKQAGAFVIPQLFDPKLITALIEHSQSEGRKTVTRVTAKSAAEGLLRAYAAAGDRKAMAQQLRGVVYQRLVRKLCTACREKRVAPDLVKKLGGDPRVQDFIYAPKTIPAELPKNYQPCPHCDDLGYTGRIGVFEIIEVNDAVRQTLLTQPKVEAITQAARKTGALSMMQAGYPLILQGVTSVEELKRVCSE